LFIPHKDRAEVESDASFNPSVGILFVHTGLTGNLAEIGLAFQSLGRDSVCSYPQASRTLRRSTPGFNPSVGILFVHTAAIHCPPATGRSFNPSVGILFVHTRYYRRLATKNRMFQSLGRDSVCSYMIWTPMDSASPKFQSLGRDSVCSYSRPRSRSSSTCWRFNPSVGILFVHTHALPALLAGLPCFNPSVGILFVHTLYEDGGTVNKDEFQSLGRDSVCSYLICFSVILLPATVSIPRSGFCLFILHRIGRRDRRENGFNPSVGILFVHTARALPSTLLRR